MLEEYRKRFNEVIELLIDQNDPCCDSAIDEIEFAEELIEYLQHRIKGLKKNETD